MICGLLPFILDNFQKWDLWTVNGLPFGAGWVVIGLMNLCVSQYSLEPANFWSLWKYLVKSLSINSWISGQYKLGASMCWVNTFDMIWRGEEEEREKSRGKKENAGVNFLWISLSRFCAYFSSFNWYYIFTRVSKFPMLFLLLLSREGNKPVKVSSLDTVQLRPTKPSISWFLSLKRHSI